MNRFIETLVLCYFAFTVSGIATADDFPSKPIKIIVPFPVGGSADVGARKLGSLLSHELGQAVVIDNRAGAGGNIGTALVAKSTPNGYTLGFISKNTMAVNPHVYSNAGFDPLREFVPITLSVRLQGILLVRAQSPIASVADLLRLARAQPGKLSYATAGVGSAQHLQTERLKQLASIELLHVPYKGEAQYYPDLLTGQVDLAFGYSAAALPQLRAGKLRALAVSATRRLAALPDVPTLAEAGVAGYDESIWSGYAAPAGTPLDRVRKLQEAFHAAMRTLDYRKFTDELGYDITPTTSEETAALIKADYERYGKIINTLGLRVE